jgi:hypothetical protein
MSDLCRAFPVREVSKEPNKFIFDGLTPFFGVGVRDQGGVDLARVEALEQGSRFKP